jgi:hypothetical protein
MKQTKKEGNDLRDIVAETLYLPLLMRCWETRRKDGIV